MSVTYTPAAPGDAPALVALFTRTFTASDGADEGARIGTLVTRLMAGAAATRQAFAARTGDALVGGVVFSPLVFGTDPRAIWMLSPMAVSPERQGQGLGQGLIRAALDALRAQGVAGVVTYGDPAFYGRVGFAPVTTDSVPAPHPLSMPQGWQAQSLTGAPLAPLPGPSTAHPAFDDPTLW